MLILKKTGRFVSELQTQSNYWNNRTQWIVSYCKEKEDEVEYYYSINCLRLKMGAKTRAFLQSDRVVLKLD